jgi:hypothetical protein
MDRATRSLGAHRPGVAERRSAHPQGAGLAARADGDCTGSLALREAHASPSSYHDYLDRALQSYLDQRWKLAG